VLDMIEVLPEHRGRHLGIAVASRLIDILGQGAGIVVCKPFPLQFNPNFHDDKTSFIADMRFEEFETSEEVALRRIRKYWSKLGFKKIGGRYVYGLSLSKLRPKLDEICDVNLH